MLLQGIDPIDDSSKDRIQSIESIQKGILIQMVYTKVSVIYEYEWKESVDSYFRLFKIHYSFPNLRNLSFYNHCLVRVYKQFERG